MPALNFPADDRRVRLVGSFEELIGTPFADGINALCWERSLPGDFAEVVRLLGPGEGIHSLDDEQLLALPVSPAGRVAIGILLEDQERLRERGLDPVLDCIHGYLRDADPGTVPTDVCSFHVDSASVEADTWLCTYHGPSSEGLRNEDAVRRIDLPETRAELLRRYGGADDGDFAAYLAENCFDLHYLPRPGGQPFVFGTGNLWRIATQWPGSPVPPCIHRAPETQPGDLARLLLIS